MVLQFGGDQNSGVWFWGKKNIWVFPKIGVGPKSSILIGFSIINHPFWEYQYFWKHPYHFLPRFCQKFPFCGQLPQSLHEKCWLDMKQDLKHVFFRDPMFFAGGGVENVRVELCTVYPLLLKKNWLHFAAPKNGHHQGCGASAANVVHEDGKWHQEAP